MFRAHVLYVSAVHAEHGDLADPARVQKRAALGEELIAGRVGALGEGPGRQRTDGAYRCRHYFWEKALKLPIHFRANTQAPQYFAHVHVPQLHDAMHGPIHWRLGSEVERNGERTQPADSPSMW